MDTCEALAIPWRCHEERDLGVVSEIGKSLATNRSWPHMCRDPMVLVPHSSSEVQLYLSER